MAVVIETTLGDITVDLYLEQRPATCLNFLKLCKMKYYNFNLFHTIRSGFIAQTGDPTGEGSGGESIWGVLEGNNKRFFSGEKMPKIRHTDAGLLSMVCTDNMMVGSQFFFTLAPDLDSLDGVHCVIGEVTEGHEVLTKLNEVICDETHRPYQDVRITHTVVLEDPFNDIPGLRPPSRSPSPTVERLKGGRIAPDEEIDERQGKSHEEIQEMIEEKEAKARATILEIVGDLPDADIAPPENVLFVCKLNPVTTDDDLEIIFSRFGKIVSCEVIRDKKTGDSLQYAFIEFEDKKSCEDAYFKMDNVLIDDRRIHVDFSQSVSKMRWLGKGRGVQYFNDKESKTSELINNQSKRSHSRERNDSRRQYYKDREYKDRNSTNRNDKKTNHQKERRQKDRSRSRSRRDTSENMNTKNDRNQSDKNHPRKLNAEKLDKSHSNKNINERSKCDNSNNKPGKSITPSPTNDKRKHTISPIRKQKENMDNKSNYTNKTSDDSHTSNSHNTSKKDCRDGRETKHLKSSLTPKIKKENSRPSSRIACEARSHTPSPVIAERELKSKLKMFVEQQKVKRKVKVMKKRRTPSTSSSETDSSLSSSSTSMSSASTSEEDNIKQELKANRCSSSSSSSSTSSSSSSSGSSSSSTSSTSESSVSSSESEDGKKKRKNIGNKKQIVKKTKKL